MPIPPQGKVRFPLEVVCSKAQTEFVMKITIRGGGPELVFYSQNLAFSKAHSCIQQSHSFVQAQLRDKKFMKMQITRPRMVTPEKWVPAL
jgi:hypothetical protein